MKKRYCHEIADWDLPKRNERSIFLGKIAETKHEAFLDVDELTKHMIIAGSTGSGKTVTAQVLVEEALQKGISVIVIDPTVQWTGFMKPLRDEAMRNRYELFKMRKSETRGWPAEIIKASLAGVDEKSFQTNPGELKIFVTSHLREKEIDVFITNIISSFFAKTPLESQKLTTLLVFEEIHRILPKYGGQGIGLVALERAVREFRKWGIGIILISQVLEDFAGEIRANIGTELQLRTAYEEDLDKVRLKYGDPTAKAVVREETGTAMLHNSSYNIGKPFFVMIRPPYHDISRISEPELDKYEQLVKCISSIQSQTSLKEDELLNLKLARKELIKGNFRSAEAYLDEMRRTK